MSTKPGRIVTYLESLLPLKSQPFDHVFLVGQVTNWNHYISTTIAPIAAKLGMMVTYLK